MNIVIAIDCWERDGTWKKDRMVEYCNNPDNNIEAVLFATYNYDHDIDKDVRPPGSRTSAYMTSRLTVPYEELIPEVYGDKSHVERPCDKNRHDIILLEKSYDFESIIMMGGAWKDCLHDRSYGIKNLHLFLPHKEILVEPSTIVHTDNTDPGGTASYDIVNGDKDWTPKTDGLFKYSPVK